MLKTRISRMLKTRISRMLKRSLLNIGSKFRKPLGPY